MSYRLLRGAEDDIDRILIRSAEAWGLDAAVRYNRLMLAAFDAIGTRPDLRGSRAVPGLSGVRAYHLRLGRMLVEPGQRVSQPSHVVVYRSGHDRMVEVWALRISACCWERRRAGCRRTRGSDAIPSV